MVKTKLKKLWEISDSSVFQKPQLLKHQEQQIKLYFEACRFHLLLNGKYYAVKQSDKFYQNKNKQ